jgi:5-methylcytosine-specific restriction endonuclease McrA
MSSAHLVSSVSPTPLIASDDAHDDARPDAERIGDAIADLAARVHAATYELLVLIRKFDASGAWSDAGARSCAHWLNWRIGLGLGAAREKVRVATALAELPLVSGAMQRGALSYSKVRALTRVATPENEARLVDLALSASAAQVERFARAWRRTDRLVAVEETAQRHLHRHLDVWVDDDGMVVLRGRLSPEVGAVVQRGLEAAADRLFQESRQADDAHEMAQETTASQRRADALGLLAESALAHALDRGTAGDRYQVVLHVEGDSLRTDGDEGQAVLEDAGGSNVSEETSQRLACDASVVLMRHVPDGTALDVGRKTRTIPPAIRRALAARDHQCRFPGCSARHCDAHHIHHWAKGGSTKLDNLVLLCRRHHRAVHEEGFTMTRRADGALMFRRPDGVAIPLAPALPDRGAVDRAAPLAPTIARLADQAITIDARTTTPRSDGERFDLGWALDVLYVPAGTSPHRH